jgi:type I restriction enzyme S subunit
VNAVRLGDLVEPVSRADPRRTAAGRIRYIDISAVDRETKSVIAPVSMNGADAPTRARQIVAHGDVLISTVRPGLNGVAFIDRDLDSCFVSTGFCVLRVRGGVEPEYLYYFVQTPAFIAHLAKIADGASYPAVTDDDVLDAELPLPPRTERQALVRRLQLTQRMRMMRRFTLDMSSGILEAEFRARFARGVAKGAGGVLGDKVSITGGGTPSRSRPDYFRGRIPWVTSKDMRGPYLWDSEEHITEAAVENSATKLVPKDSLLVVVKSKVLARRLPIAIGKVALCHGQDIKSIQCKDGVHPEFVRHLLKFHEQRLLGLARGANTEGLTIPMLEELPLPKLSTDDQRHFVQRVLTCEKLRAAQQEASRQTDHLYASLLREIPQVPMIASEI